MKRVILLFFLSIIPCVILAQIVLTIEGTEVNDTVTGVSEGVVIPRNQRTIFTYRNNSITTVNSAGYMLQAGDEMPGINNNNLEGAKITGNRFTWNGTDETSMTHALFTGYNLNIVIKYNYLDNTPNGIQRKSNGMTDVSGVIAYNIINNPKVGIVAKGMSGVRIFNNTLYCERTNIQTSRGLIDIHTNFDGELSAASVGTKIFNNIFYTRNQTLNIKIYESACLEGFESDYNLFWCESGSPIFEISGQRLTFTQWQALGYDKHSVVLDPVFNDFVSFVPEDRLEYGTNLGEQFITGLSFDAEWGKTDPEKNDQNGIWQVGARVHDEVLVGKGIKFYPNPANQFFYVIIFDAGLTYNLLKVYDPAGRNVLTDNVQHGANLIEIPDHFTSGIYIISLESATLKRYNRKLEILR